MLRLAFIIVLTPTASFAARSSTASIANRKRKCQAVSVQMCEEVYATASSFGSKTADAAFIAEVLAQDVAEVGAALKVLTGSNSSASCSRLCNALLNDGKQYLGSKIPSQVNQACLDARCQDRMDVDDMVLAHYRLSSPYEDEGEEFESEQDFEPRSADDDELAEKHGAGTSSASSGAIMRQMLNVFFALYPAPDDTQGVKSPFLGPKLARRAELKKKMFTAVQKANAWMASSLRKLGGARAKNFVRKWFGQHADQDLALHQIRQVLSEAQQAVSNAVIRKGGGGHDRYGGKHNCGDTNTTYAYVYPGLTERVGTEHRHVIYMCDFVLGMDDWVEVSGTLIHEATHHFGTFDFEYGHGPCEELAKNDPMSALHNADNFEYFVDDLVANWQQGSEKTWLKPLEDSEGTRWEVGQQIAVRDYEEAPWKLAWVVGIKHGLVIARLPSSPRKSWRWFNHVSALEDAEDAVTMGDRVLVKDKKNDKWQSGTVIGLDGAEQTRVYLDEHKERRPCHGKRCRHRKSGHDGWKYVELEGSNGQRTEMLEASFDDFDDLETKS